jgi:hypothetical protein
VVEEVLHCAIVFIINNNTLYYQEGMIMRDDACDTSSDYSAYNSSRQAMEQVMDAVVDADVDVAIPQLSQPSQLSSVSLEANEAPVLPVTGMRYAVVIAECE